MTAEITFVMDTGVPYTVEVETEDVEPIFAHLDSRKTVTVWTASGELPRVFIDGSKVVYAFVDYPDLEDYDVTD